MSTLHIRQDAPHDGRYPIRLTLERDRQAKQEASAHIEFALTEQEQEDLRWYLEDYLQRAESVEPVTVQQVEALMKSRGEELYKKVMTANAGTQALWFSIRNDLADLRVEITTGVAEAASIPWELMRDPVLDSPISLRVQSFVRVQSNPNISFVPVEAAEDGRIRLLYIACRPSGARDVELRAVANRLLQDLGPDRARFDIKALRPPTFEQLQKELADAKHAGRPYHIVHFDGHGIYTDLSKTTLADWLGALSTVTLGAERTGKHGYLLFEHPCEDKMRPVDGQTLGQLLHDNGVPVLILNACQSAMHEATEAPKTAEGVHEEVRAIGSLSQAVIDQGIPAVLGMRYSVYVVTAAQYIGQLYAALANGRSFGQAATDGRKHLQLNPGRWLGLQPRPLQDWFVPVAYEAGSVELLPAGNAPELCAQLELDPLQSNRVLLPYVPEEGFIGRDETLLALDRAFDSNRVVLLHAYAGQGKSSTAVEFARWYALTGGLGESPLVVFASFAQPTDLGDRLTQIGQLFTSLLERQGILWGTVNDPEKRRQLVLQLLRVVPILWIWDNVEPVAGFPVDTPSQWTDDEQEDLRDFLQQIKLDNSSRVKILLTSRRDETNWLGAIPHRIAMPPMSGSDAAKLALKLGEEKQLNRAEIVDWQPLLDYCAGNPLTLRVLVGQAVKTGLRGRQRIEEFVQAIRAGEQRIEDADEHQGREKSLGASLDYGFRNAFQVDELPTIALLHLFQGTLEVVALVLMGKGEPALPELIGKSEEQLTRLFQRAAEAGLLTRVGSTLFSLHPALPWYMRKLFASHFDGQDGRSSSVVALHAWVQAVGELGGFYCGDFLHGNRGVISVLQLQEANLLQARRLAHHLGFWRSLIGCMQGIRVLYRCQCRTGEWARLVEEIVPDYCPAEGESIGGDEFYSVVMSYRVELARDHERDIAKAIELHKKHLEWDRRRAAVALTVPADAPLDSDQCVRLEALAVAHGGFGQTLLELGDADCVHHIEEAICLSRRLGQNADQSNAESSLGQAYMDIPAIRDLDAAEEAYQRSLALHSPDVLGRSRCLMAIGMVHHERFRDARVNKESFDTVLRHAQAAEKQILDALRQCPDDAVRERGTAHNQLGNLYLELGRHNSARRYYEKAAQYHARANDRFRAGTARFNLAYMYLQSATSCNQRAEKGAYLQRARAYAGAALRDFEQYQGRAPEDETRAVGLLYQIDQALAHLAQ
jgi:tetratricopeptide (TPR) repeat protein